MTVDRIRATFRACADQGRAALVGYLTAFDPDREGSLERIRRACASGIDVLELGVPFSDPNADGPEIQAAMVRALGAGASVAGVLELAATLRREFELPIVLFGYANPMVRYGATRLCDDAATAGADALLCVDLPPEHCEVLRTPAVAAGLGWTGLVAPTSTPERIAAVAEVSAGFVYAVTLRGVTGATLQADAPDLARQLRQIREHTDLPIAAGFGVREPEQAARLARHADGVVVGTALIAAARQGHDALAQRVAALRGGLSRPAP